MKHDISRMGPAYVKVGQFIAARSDVFPKYITSELSGLHDDVQPEPFESIVNILQKECDMKHFLSIDETPLSTASIGQIHHCVLKDYPDTPVVMKVRKPNVDQQVRDDFEALTNIIECCRICIPGNRMISDLYSIVEQCKRSVYQELDFEIEKKNLKALRVAFKDTSVVVPRVVGPLSTDKVLLLEYVPSKKLTQGTNTTELVKTIFLCGLQFGVIHGDLHPGNIGLIDNDQFVLYDTGSVIYVNPQMIKDLFTGILSKNTNMVMTKLLENNLVYVTREPEGSVQLNHAVRYIIDYIDHVNVQKLIAQVKSDPVLNTTYLHFRIDPDLFLLSRTMSLLEGTCKHVNTEFSYNDILLDMLTDTDVLLEYMDMTALLQRGLSDIQRMQQQQVGEPALPDTSVLEKNTKVFESLIVLLLFLNLIF
jgi:predicted unusual protein kinase regulating ubiquinone biosynthesis (AarF/ABC1/UbiB family)